jgi:DNA-binding NarL/FixJ family response regulator
MRATKIMIVSHQHLFRIELRQAISKSAALEAIEIRECDRSEVNSDTITEIMATSPDIVLLDIGYPSFNGLYLARKIAETLPRIGVILLSGNLEDADNELFEAAQSGAVAYIITRGKQTVDAELIEAMKQASTGERPIIDKVINSPNVARRILKRFHDMTSVAGTTKEAVAFQHNLDLEELEVLQLISKGHQREQIASVLGVSELTIGERVSSILFKLNSNERTLDLFIRARASLLSVQLARDGNLFILNASPSPCQPQLLHNDAHRR